MFEVIPMLGNSFVPSAKRKQEDVHVQGTPLVNMMLIRSCMIGSGGVHRSIQGLFCLADGWAAGGLHCT